MNNNFIQQLESNPYSSAGIYNSIFHEYEKVVIKALITSFGLDFLVNDQYGGDVDTINNVRKIGIDPEIKYKKKENEVSYDNRGEYNDHDYHSGGNYQKIKNEARKQYYEDFKEKYDEYEGKEKLGFFGHHGPSDKNAELDHIVEAKHIHDDRGRVLAGLEGVPLADSVDNFAWTNKSLNASMGSWARHKNEKWKKEHDGQDAPMSELDMKAYLKVHPEIDKETQKNMLDKYEKAKKAYEQKLALTYYTSKKFVQETGVAAAKTGVSMGLRQALGLIFSEIWFSVKDTIISFNGNSKKLFNDIGKAIKKAFANCKTKFTDIWGTFIEGAVAGVLSSLITTLTNVFFTTAKNMIKIIRESWASIVSASKILFVNPDYYPFGDRILAATKVLATGASVVAGAMVGEVLINTPIGDIPIIKQIIPSFLSTLVTGIMSCTFLYMLDTNKKVKKVIERMNRIPTAENFIVSLLKQEEIFDKYLLILKNTDIDELKRKVICIKSYSEKLDLSKSDEEMSGILIKAYEDMNLDLPWKNYYSFDSFMKDKSSRLIFC